MRALLIALSFLAFAAPALAEDAPSAELIARAQTGDLEAAEELGSLYGARDEFAAAIRWSRRAADGGRPEAMANLAAYLRLEGRDRDADRWERRALQAGSNGARFNVAARIIATPNVADRDWARAIALLSNADHPEAAHILEQVSAAYDQAPYATPPRQRELTQLAADRGVHAAQWRMAMMARAGFGGGRDLARAYYWTLRAAEGGDLNGMLSAGVMLATGEGVARDAQAAADWYQRAIDQHKSAHALRSLGAMYLSGELPADHARGFAYLMIAFQAGEQMAPAILQRFSSLATPSTLQEAAELRDAWTRENGPAR